MIKNTFKVEVSFNINTPKGAKIGKGDVSDLISSIKRHLESMYISLDSDEEETTFRHPTAIKVKRI